MRRWGAISKKKTVSIRYEPGFERMIPHGHPASLSEMGLHAHPVPRGRLVCESMSQTAGRRASGDITAHPANKQYEYDHRYDQRHLSG
ncbi:MAG: hypothetical protein ACLUD2_14115 [Clostridium sp.]